MNDEAEVTTYHDQLPALAEALAEGMGQAVVVLDASDLGSIEQDYGSDAFGEVRSRIMDLLRKERGRAFRSDDVLTLDAPHGLRFVFFLSRKRRKGLPWTGADMRAARGRIAGALVPGIARAAFPYARRQPQIDVGYGLALFNPLIHVDRTFRRAIAEALEVAAHERQAAHLQVRERLQDLILRERVVTAYQPIMSLRDRSALGYEGLSRGARGSGLETADALFEAAAEHGLLVELDRLCRKRALLSAGGRVPTSARVFVNTLPATIRDPQFRGRPLIEFLEQAGVAPQRIVIEITEKLVIENYALFREAMAYFSDLGMSFAVDDVGAGYSGLEAIARLKPAFLKIDIALVRDVHVSRVNRAMVKAIVGLGAGIGATVIAEGIQADAEVVALREMGIEWGQGFLLARPEAPAE